MVGSSAGAMVWGTDIQLFLLFEKNMNFLGLTDFSSLACIPYIILPHADRLCEQYETYDEILQELHEKIGNEVLSIGNNAGALFVDDVLHFI